MTLPECLSWCLLALLVGYSLGYWRAYRKIEADVRRYIENDPNPK